MDDHLTIAAAIGLISLTLEAWELMQKAYVAAHPVLATAMEPVFAVLMSY